MSDVKSAGITHPKLLELLRSVRDGTVDIDDAAGKLSVSLPLVSETSETYARLDMNRTHRTGLPEVLYCEGKTTDQLRSIAARFAKAEGVAIATRANDEAFAAISETVPEAVFHKQARMVTVGEFPSSRNERPLLIISAGTADIPVAEEAAVTASALGLDIKRLYDVGVAGIHRLLAHSDSLEKAGVIIVVAGMEGALPSVVAGLVRGPVIAVPTSVGYGAGFAGLSSLLTMLNSCAPGIAVCNIDNGFGAACLANNIYALSSKT